MGKIEVSYKSVFDNYGAKYVSDIRRNMAEANANATGKTSDSIDYQSLDFSLNISALSSLEAAQEGTPPESQGGGITVIEADNWIKAKGINLNPEVVSLRINEEGSFFYREQDKERDLYDSTLSDKDTEEKLSEDILSKTADFFCQIIDNEQNS